MRAFLNCIRKIEKKLSVEKAIVHTIGILIFGIGLGVFSKYLDTVAFNELPRILQYLDIGNFLSESDIWIFIAVCISVYSNSPKRASINVFIFFTGMVTSYYLYSYFIAGFFPRSYAMIWIGFTLFSPALAFVCWYAKGKGAVALVVSSAIIAVLMNLSFVYGMWYFDIRSLLDGLVFLCGIIVLRRKVKETIVMLGIGSIFALIQNIFLPFYF
jgi:hypothetical protein